MCIDHVLLQVGTKSNDADNDEDTDKDEDEKVGNSLGLLLIWIAVCCLADHVYMLI